MSNQDKWYWDVNFRLEYSGGLPPHHPTYNRTASVWLEGYGCLFQMKVVEFDNVTIDPRLVEMVDLIAAAPQTARQRDALLDACTVAALSDEVINDLSVENLRRHCLLVAKEARAAIATVEGK